MRFCTACGAKKIDHTPFCNECGHKFEEVQPAENTRAANNNIPSLRALSLKKKLLIGGVLSLLIIGFTLYKVGESVTDKSRLIKTFSEHLENGDVKELVSMLESGDESTAVSEKHVKGLLAYLEEDDDLHDELIDQLRENANEDGFKPSAELFDQNGPSQLITFEKRGKAFFIYDDYDFVLQPIPLTAYTNYEDVTFFVDGKEVESVIAEDGYVDLGLFLPGEYKLKTVLSSDFAELEKEVDVNLLKPESLDLSLDIRTVDIEANVSDAKILVDGKDTGVVLNSDKEAEIGPVLADGSMSVQIEKETPFGVAQSPKVPIDDYYVQVNLALSKEQREAVTSKVKEYLQVFSEAMNTQNRSLLEDYSDYGQSQYDLYANEYYAAYVNDLYVNDHAFYVEERNGQWVVNVEVLEKWKSYLSNRYDASVSEKDDDRSVTYELIYDEKKKQWSLDNLYRDYGFDESSFTKVEWNVEEEKKKLEASSVFKQMQTAEKTNGIDSFLEQYVSTSVKAINDRDFSIVSDLIDPSSTAYLKEVSDYIDYLDTKGITEDLLFLDVLEVEEKDDATVIVTVNEEYMLYYSDGSVKYKTFEAKYEVKITSDGFKMYKLIETKETSSEDL